MIVLYILTVIAILAFSFIATAGLIWLVCWAFAWTFTWKVAFGVWIVLILMRSVFKVVVKKS